MKSRGATPLRASRLDEAARRTSVFAPVRSMTAFEETVERLGTAIRLGLLSARTRLPAERELCGRLGIARSTLRQALVALGQSGHLRAIRGRGGGTFVAEPLPPAQPPSLEVLSAWRDTCDERMAVEVGIAVLAAERATPESIEALAEIADAIESMLEDFAGPTARPTSRFHVGLAEATGSPRLVTAMTETQGTMVLLISLHRPSARGAGLRQRPAPAVGGRVRRHDPLARRARDDRAHARHRARARRTAARRLTPSTVSGE